MNSVLNAVRDSSSVRDRVSPLEWQTRVDLAAAHRLAELEGWQEPYTIFNHLTARVPGEPGMMLIKPHELLFGEITASNLIKVPIDGKPMGFESNVNPAGWAIHSAVYQARPDVNAAMHVHSQPGMAISALKEGFMFLNQEAMRFYKRIGYHEFEGIAAPDERERLARDLGPHYALILRNHGVLTCNRDVASAALDLSIIMRCAEAQLRILATGQPVSQPSHEVCEGAAQLYARSKERPASWNAVRRYIDSRRPGYAE